MKITNAIRFLLIVLALVTVVALFACTDVPDANDTTAPHGNETTEQSGGETTKPKVDETTEPEGDETTEPEGGESTTSEPDDTEAPQCKHTNEVLDENCNLICADCKVILDTEQHVASAPDKDDNCNVKCTK